MRTGKKVLIAVCILLSACILLLGAMLVFPALGNTLLGTESNGKLQDLLPGASQQAATPDEVLAEYMACIENRDYEKMYSFLSDESKTAISEEDFIKKNKNIYEGIEAKNIIVTVSEAQPGEAVSYSLQMDTLAGKISYDAAADFTQNPEKGYGLNWSARLIFPDLALSDKVRVNTFKAERGCIYDRNEEMLAGPGIASSVGLVPGKMRKDGEVASDPESPRESVGDDSDTIEAPEIEAETDVAPEPSGEPDAASATRASDIAKAAELLEITPESIEKKLSASYVKDDTFVPLKVVSKEAYDLKGELLTIPGIKIIDTKVRYYPLGEKASHLTGYIQSINAEELDALRDQGYNASSVLGKAGLEKIYEERLRAVDGYEIVITNAEGETKETLAKTEKRDGEDIRLTIDAKLQSDLFDQFSGDKSCSVALNPKTGEVLALTSTPAYDANDFVLGMSAKRWAALNEDESRPLLNRFKAALCPGSTFKTVTGAIGVDTGLVPPDYDFGHSGLTWRKDSSWGSYYVKTLKDYGDEAKLKEALTYSDNIYFAKAALKIGADRFAQELKRIGFEERIPFEYGLYSSTISSTETFTSEIQLADSGYGQGQILVNPVHFASVYSAFVNGGGMIKPRLLYDANVAPAFWKEDAFLPETAKVMRDALISVVERGTGTEARIKGVELGGKTGTAEIKQSKDDETGTELGWFVLFTADTDYHDPLLVVSMAEDVKNRGGSHYVSPRVKAVFLSRWGRES